MSDDPAQIKVLHIEDDASVARSVARLLGLHKFQVFSAATGDEAIQLVEDGLIPDLILTDYYLPLQMTGDQIVIEIEKRLGFKPPTIMLASVLDIAGEKITTFADVSIAKPTDTDMLVREMGRLLGTRP